MFCMLSDVFVMVIWYYMHNDMVSMLRYLTTLSVLMFATFNAEAFVKNIL